MDTTNVRDSILLIGASGRTGRHVLRYLGAASVPVIACLTSADRDPFEAALASTEIALVDLEKPHTLAPWMERAAHVIYLAGTNRKSLSPGAWQVEIDGLADALELAQRTELPGRWISVGWSGSDQRAATSWAEIRWRELKVAAEEVITSSDVNYFIVRTGMITDPMSIEPRVSVTQDAAVAGGEVPCNALAFLLAGTALAGATNRSRVTVRLDRHGLQLQSAVHAFSRLRTDDAIRRTSRLLRHS